MLYIILGILVFGLLIAIHEGGHFLAAKTLDVQVNEFSVGMGPALLTRQRGETLYALRALPIGGYCAMEGEDEESENPRAFSSKSPWKKVVILVAGAACNYLAGLLIVILLVTSVGSYVTPVLSGFMEGCPSAGETGLREGDRILSVNGHRVYIQADLSYWLQIAGEGPKDLVVERDGEKVSLPGLPLDLREYEVDGETVKMYGLYFTREENTLLGVLRQSWYTSLYYARAVWQGLGMLATGQVRLDNLSGPVGIVSLMGEAGEESANLAEGLRNIGSLSALIAVNLAVMNLLPLPALDGGRIFFLAVSELWRLMTGRSPDPRYEALIHGAGFLLLMLLMLVITFNDVRKLIV